MKSIKLSNYLNIIKPEYVYIKLTPNNSIRNQSSHKIAKAISSLYKNIRYNIKKEEVKVLKMFKKEFLFGTKYSYERSPKVSYYIYIEKKKVEFYFIIPKQHLSYIKEKTGDVWKNITFTQVETFPEFSNSAVKYSMTYTKEDGLSLATDRRDSDLLHSKLNIVDVMEEGDKVGVFYNFIPITQYGWRNAYQSTINKVKRNLPTDRNKIGLGYVFKMSIGIIASIIDDIGETVGGENKRKKGQQDMDLMEGVLTRLNGDKQISESTRKKGNSTVLGSQIVVLSESQDPIRQQNNARSMTQAFETITDDNRLKAKKLNTSFNMTSRFISGAEINKVGDEESQNFISIAGRDILERYNFIEKIETQEAEVPEDLQKGIMCIGESTFRGHKQKAYLSNDFNYRNLLALLIGPTRAGKSNLIGNLSMDAIENGECVIIFDFIMNNELSDEISSLFPKSKVLNIDNSDHRKLQGLGFNEYPQTLDPIEAYENAKKQTANFLTLVNAINVDESRLSAKMERYLEASSLVVFINRGSFNDVFRVLQYPKDRHEWLKKVPNNQLELMEEYMSSLGELDKVDNDGNVTTKYNLIEGILDRLAVLKRNTQMELMLKQDVRNNINLVDEIQKNQVICIRMPESKFPTQGERDIASTYWITKIWSALQIRSDQIKDPSKRTKLNIVIDEIYQVKNTEKFFTDKLSQIAKFTAKPIVSCHYINQLNTKLRSELRSANTSYILISGCDKDNFNELKEELHPFTSEDLKNLKPYHAMNYVKCKDGHARFITKLPDKVENRIKRGRQKEVQ